MDSLNGFLADSGFYRIELIQELESRGLEYGIAAPLHWVLQQAIYEVPDWEAVLFYNLIQLFRSQILPEKEEKKTIGVLRMKYFVIPGVQTAAAAIAPCSLLPAAELLPEPEDTPYRKACRRTWAKLIEKIYLVSPLICPKCQFPMKIISFIEDQTVVRKILQHLGIWETLPRPPPKKIISSCTVEPIPADCLPWAADPVYEYDHVDPVYED